MPEIKDISKIGKISRIGKEKILLLALAGIMLVGASYFENIKDKKVLKMCEASALHKSKADFQENGGYLYD